MTPVACPGLATAIDAGDAEATEAAIADAALRTPADCGAVVMGCTEYELAADQIRLAMPGADPVRLRRRRRGSSAAPRTQGQAGAVRSALSAGPGADIVSTGTLTVILSGRRADLPPAALRYRQGRELASLLAGFDPVAGQPA